MQVEDGHIVKLVSIKSQVPDTNTSFTNVLQDGVDVLLRSKNIRDLAAAKM